MSGPPPYTAGTRHLSLLFCIYYILDDVNQARNFHATPPHVFLLRLFAFHRCKLYRCRSRGFGVLCHGHELNRYHQRSFPLFTTPAIKIIIPPRWSSLSNVKNEAPSAPSTPFRCNSWWIKSSPHGSRAEEEPASVPPLPRHCREARLYGHDATRTCMTWVHLAHVVGRVVFV